jgi:hypothetical protein
MSAPFWIEFWIPYPWISTHQRFFFWALSKQAPDAPWFGILHLPAWGLAWLWQVRGLPLIPGGGDMVPIATQLIVVILIQWIVIGFGLGFLLRWMRNRSWRNQ